MPLRPYQVEALTKSKERYDAGLFRQLVSLPTGMGKTVIFADLKRNHNFNKRVMVLAHREELIEQAKSKIQHWNPQYRIGVEKAEQYADKYDDVVIASVQSIGTAGTSRLDRFDPRDFDAIICDEAHHSIAPTYRRPFAHFGIPNNEHNILLFGVTATPNRGDGQGMGQMYDEIVYQKGILEAINDGWLSNIRGIKITSKTDLSGVSTRAGDFSQGELEEAVNVDERNHLIVQNWLRSGQDRQTIAFCVDIAHAKRLAEVFKSYGVAAEAVWGTDPDRAEKLKYHRAKHLKVLTNCGVLTEGYDDWQISCIIMARPTKSQLLFVQMGGRGLRIPEFPNGISLLEAEALKLDIPKRDCLLMDVVDNTGRHSLVTLSSLFGLGEKVNFKGKTITEAKAQFDAARQANPQANLNQIESLDDIPAEVERVDLLAMPKWEPEVLENSNLRWVKTIGGDYLMTIPPKDSVVVYRDLLDKWNIKGRVNSITIDKTELPDIQTAFKAADDFVTEHGRGLLTLLRREMKWHKNPASILQKNWLRKLYKYDSSVLGRIDSLNKEEARVLIDRKINKNTGAKAVGK